MVTNHNGKVFSTFDKGEKQAKARMFGAGWWYGEIESVNWFTGYWKQYLNITNPAVTITAVDCIITRYVWISEEQTIEIVSGESFSEYIVYLKYIEWKQSIIYVFFFCFFYEYILHKLF